MQIKNKEQKLSKLKTLVEKFSNNIDEYKNPNYNEANLRLEFLNPFFELLDWDVRNEQNFHINYKEVLVEETIDVYGTRKNPDYTFRIGSQTKFYVEAKKPSVDIKDSIEPAFQVKRYGHSAKLSISVLTDFEEFAIYDTRKLPHKNDKPQKNRIYYYKFNQYIEKFDEIYNLLSKPAIMQGSFEKFEKEDKYRKGSQTVDEGILDLVSKFREKLAKNIAKNNKNIDVFSLNKAVIKIIDRILFLRIAEDKNIEVYKTLLNIAQSPDIYKQLKKVFVQADKRYNSELFKYFKQIDDITIDDKILKEIITSLYEDCPYEFSVIPVSILGSMYEQFLGKTIHITQSNLVKIEDKPEVKKAGGVYYTPEYIVKYIVENTVGKKIQGLTPKQIEKIKIVDPACGSGSFLIGAYQYLLDYHLKYYTKDENIENAKNKKIIKETKAGYILSIPEKQKILTNNIFGVDIDQQAVEVAKFSLLLKLMESEKQDVNELIPYAQQYSNIKLLPNLNKNIQCGNSLIGTDYYTNADMALIDQDEIQKINAFDWDKSFPEIFSTGGFDCVIGNPPYINIENLTIETRNYLMNNFDVCVGRTDIYIAFIDKSVKLLKRNGLLSFIIPYAFTNQIYGSYLRNKIVDNYNIKNIVDTSNYYVFDTAQVKNIIFVLEKDKTKKQTNIVSYKNETCFKNNEFLNNFNINQDLFKTLKDCRWETKNIFDSLNIKEKILKKSIQLKDICLVAYGARLNHKTKPIPKKFFINNDYKKGFKPFLEGENIQRYYHEQAGWLDYQPTQHYNPMFKELFENEKIICINVVKDRLRFTYDNKNLYNSHTVINCVKYENLLKAQHTTVKKLLKEINLDLQKNYSLKFLLTLLNSNLLNRYFVNFQSEGVHFYPNDAKNLPIPKIDLNNKKQKEYHDNLVNLADQMIQIKQKINSARSFPNASGGDTSLSLVIPESSNRESIKNKTQYNQTYIENLQKIANSIDDKIDNIVYKLYNLTEEEIKIIENNL